MKRNLSKVNDQETLNKKIEKLEKRNKKLRVTDVLSIN